MQCRASATMCAGWHPMGQLYAPGLAQPRLPQCASQGWRALHRPLLQLLDWRGLGLRVRLSASLCILGASEYTLVHPFSILEGGKAVLWTKAKYKGSSGEAEYPGAGSSGCCYDSACLLWHDSMQIDGE